jgi:hypothetical protein
LDYSKSHVYVSYFQTYTTFNQTQISKFISRFKNIIFVYLILTRMIFWKWFLYH